MSEKTKTGEEWFLEGIDHIYFPKDGVVRHHSAKLCFEQSRNLGYIIANTPIYTIDFAIIPNQYLNEFATIADSSIDTSNATQIIYAQIALGMDYRPTTDTRHCLEQAIDNAKKFKNEKARQIAMIQFASRFDRYELLTELIKNDRFGYAYERGGWSMTMNPEQKIALHIRGIEEANWNNCRNELALEYRTIEQHKEANETMMEYAKHLDETEPETLRCHYYCGVWILENPAHGNTNVALDLFYKCLE